MNHLLTAQKLLQKKKPNAHPPIFTPVTTTV